MSAACSNCCAASGRVPCYETYLCKEQIGLVSELLVRLDSRLQTLTLILTLTLGPSPNPSGGNGITEFIRVLGTRKYAVTPKDAFAKATRHVSAEPCVDSANRLPGLGARLTCPASAKRRIDT